MKSLLTALVLVSSMTTACLAQQNSERDYPRNPPPEIVEQFDADGDGRLNREEHRAARDARRAQRGDSSQARGDNSAQAQGENGQCRRRGRGQRRGARRGRGGGGN